MQHMVLFPMGPLLPFSGFPVAAQFAGGLSDCCQFSGIQPVALVDMQH
jgi:hypothetical protein